MIKQAFKTTVAGVATALVLATTPAMAQEAKSLDELLSFVKKGQTSEARENKEREERFLSEQSKQRGRLAGARKALKREEDRSAALEKKFEEQELLLTEKQKQLKDRLGTLTELFGHLTSTAGDMRSNFQNSLISVQYPGREKFLDELIAKMSAAEDLPSIEEIERIWYELQREMTESGKVVKFDTEITSPAGEKSNGTVVRIGTYNIVDSNGNYLQYIPENGSVAVLARQPSGKYTGWGEDLASASGGTQPFGVDPTGPSGGSYLAALIDSPTIAERWHQGGVVGYIITAVGVVAVLIALWRLVVLTLMSGKVSAQMKKSKADTNNPLGRVLKVHEDNPTMDAETMELKLSEAVLNELPGINNSLNLLKVIASVAPLLGLLGTVTGMIITFQAITIFGAGDPKAMAGGISGALVTTVLGLCVAIPTVLLHTVVNGRAQKVVHILEEQTLGLIAEHTEAGNKSA